MKRLFLALALVAVPVGAALYLLRPKPFSPSGPTVYVLLDERHRLAAGDTVVLEDVVIGRVESVKDEGRRVRVAVKLDGARAEGLRSGTTFKPEGFVDRKLGAHVIDPESGPLADGATVEGCDSIFELLFKEGQHEVSGWMKELERRIEEIDVSELTKDAAVDVKRLSKELAEAAGQTREEARDAYTKLRPEVDRMAKELERLGKSREAQELKRRFERLLSKERT